MMRDNAVHRLDSTRLELVIHHATGSSYQDAQRESTLNPPSAPFSQAWGEGMGMRVGDPLRLESKEQFNR